MSAPYRSRLAASRYLRLVTTVSAGRRDRKGCAPRGDLRRDVDELAALAEEIASYPIPAGESGPDTLRTVEVRLPDGLELSFFGMFATFDTPFDVTSSELAAELLFPADRRDRDRAQRARARADEFADPLRFVIRGGGALLIASLFMSRTPGRSGCSLLTSADARADFSLTSRGQS